MNYCMLIAIVHLYACVCAIISRAGVLIGVVVNRVVFDSGQVTRVTPGPGQWKEHKKLMCPPLRVVMEFLTTDWQSC